MRYQTEFGNQGRNDFVLFKVSIMKRALRTAFVVLAVRVWLSAAFADDYPFPAIANLPERKFFGVDQYGLPHIAEKDKGMVAQLAASDQSDASLRSLAIYALAISGYSPESVDALSKVLADSTLGDRGTAAMGLGNFTMELPAKRKEELRAQLRKIMESEGLRRPPEIIRLLLVWGDAPWVAEQFGDDLTGHAMEIEIIGKLPAARATPRLLEIYRSSERVNTSESYNRRADIGRALMKYGDKRGVDILDTLLDAGSVPTLSDGSPSHQYRNNVFAAIQKAVGKKFGYEHLNYDPTIDDAIVRYREWWLRDRYEFEFPKR